MFSLNFRGEDWTVPILVHLVLGDMVSNSFVMMLQNWDLSQSVWWDAES